MKKFLLILPVLLFCASCAKIMNLDQALTLKTYSNQNDETQSFVMAQDRKFDELLSLVQSVKDRSLPDAMKRYTEKSSFRDRFGNPILIASVQRDNRSLERWLYRYQTQYFGPKVYVFFDNNGQFVTWTYVGPEKK